jgi:hypothetical protein
LIQQRDGHKPEWGQETEDEIPPAAHPLEPHVQIIFGVHVVREGLHAHQIHIHPTEKSPAQAHCKRHWLVMDARFILLERTGLRK